MAKDEDKKDKQPPEGMVEFTKKWREPIEDKGPIGPSGWSDWKTVTAIGTVFIALIIVWKFFGLGQENLTTYVTDVCPGVVKTIDLNHSWSEINPKGCRITGDVLEGAIELGDGTATFTLANASGKDATSARAKENYARFKYSLCPQRSSGLLNWDCSPMKSVRR